MICMANSLNINLETAHNIVMNKFNTRDKDRWTRIDEGEKRIMKEIKVIIAGPRGRMGHETVLLMERTEHFNLVAAIGL